MILDTNAVSALAAGDDAVAELLRQHQRVSLPYVVIAEYELGIARSRYRRKLQRWLHTLEEEHDVLYPTKETLVQYAALRGELMRQGTPIPANDVWIAALCRQHGMPILSRDQHFDEVTGLQRVGW